MEAGPGFERESSELSDETLPTAGPPREAPTRFGRFEVRERVGVGGMGDVFRAHDPQLERSVAVKVLHPSQQGWGPQAQERFLREAQAMAHLSHPNVMPIYDVGVEEGTPFIVMEYVEGQTLAQWREQKRRTWRQILALYQAAGRGLAAAHDAGFVHRDFKPANVLVGNDARVRVSDFGLVKHVAHSDCEPTLVNTADGYEVAPPTTSDLTDAGIVMGTPQYMAPEQRAGREVSAASDQYSFCVALYRAVHGHFPGVDPADGDRPALQVENLPSAVDEAIARGLKRAPSDRWPSMRALLDALQRASVRRRAAVVWGIAAVGSLGVLSGTLLSSGSDPCADTADAVQEVWSPTQSAQLSAAFEDASAQRGPAAAAHVVERITGYAQRWASAHRDVCMAERSGVDVAIAAQTARRACLQRSRERLGGLVDAFSAPDPSFVDRAAAAVDELPDPERCATLTGAESRLDPPSAAVASRVEDVRSRLNRTSSFDEAGRYDEALEAQTAIVEDARATGYQPLLAEALRELATTERRMGMLDEAEADYGEAYFGAVRADDHEGATRSAMGLAAMFAVDRADPDEARTWLRHARAELTQAPNPKDEVAALTIEALLSTRKGDFDAALALDHQALRLATEAFGANSPQVAQLLQNIGRIMSSQGDYELAIEHYRRVITLREQHLGPGHPKLGTAYSNLATALSGQGAHDEAWAQLARAETVYAGALGEGHANWASLWSNQAVVQIRRGEVEDALRLTELAAARWESTLGERHPAFAGALGNLGNLYKRTGQLKRARSTLARTASIFEAVSGADHPKFALALYNLAVLDAELGDDAAAREGYARAAEIWAESLPADHPYLEDARKGLAKLDAPEP